MVIELLFNTYLFLSFNMSSESIAGSPPSSPLIEELEPENDCIHYIRSWLLSAPLVRLKFSDPDHADLNDRVILIGTSDSIRKYSGRKRRRDAADTDTESVGAGKSKRRKEGTGSGGRGSITVGNVNGRRERVRLQQQVATLTAALGKDEETPRTVREQEQLLHNYAPELSWLGTRPGVVDIGPERAGRLVKHGYALGGPEALLEWRSVLLFWRSKDSLDDLDQFFSSQPHLSSSASAPLQVQGRGIQPSQLVPTQLDPDILTRVGVVDNLDEALDDLWSWWKATDRVEAAGTLNKIHFRLRLAFLWKKYDSTREFLEANPDQANRERAKGNRKRLRPGTLARDKVFRDMQERMQRQLTDAYTAPRQKSRGRILDVDDEAGDEEEDEDLTGEDRREGRRLGMESIVEEAEKKAAEETRREEKRFERRLGVGGRWYRFMTRFGKFALAMIPSDIISDNWVEKMKKEEFDAWLDFTEKYNPDIKAWRLFEDVMDDMIDGKGPPGQICKLERLRYSLQELEGLNTGQRLLLLKFVQT
jgi:hypothetical protein